MTPSDFEAAKLLAEGGTPFCVVMTKCDQVRTDIRGHREMVGKVWNKLGALDAGGLYPHAFVTSSRSGDGIAHLRTFLMVTTGMMYANPFYERS